MNHRILGAVLLIIAILGCVGSERIMVVKPTVTTQSASNKSWRNSGYDATLNGNITDTGGEDCTERGFEWGSSSGDYTQGWNEGPGPFGTGAFDRPDSFHGTVYYRAYAMNSAGYGYGNERVISPPPPPPDIPTVTTQDADNKSWKTETFYWATLHGTIVDTGGENCVQGFEWGSSSGNYTQGYELPGTHGTGPFEHIDSFTGTVYYRAYARNSEGEGYGAEKSFTPPPPPPEDFFGDQTEYTDNGQLFDGIHGCRATCLFAKSASSITVRVKASAAGSRLIKCALYRASDDGFVAETEERNVSLTTSWAWETFTFPSPPELSIQDYYIVAWAENYEPPFTFIAYTLSPTAYKRVFRSITYDGWSATSGVDEYPGSAAIYCTYTGVLPDPPTVTTQPATNIGETTATLNGTITDTGGEDCDERGFDWGSSSGNYDEGWNEGPGPFGTGSFTHADNFRGTVYYRAYAKNSAGYGYGGEQSFLCVPAAPTNVQATDGEWTSKVVIEWTKSLGATAYQVYRDGVGLGWLGDVDDYNDTGADAPTITPGNAVASDGTFYDVVALYLSGTHFYDGNLHTYKVKAKNAAGESGYSGTNEGYRKCGTPQYQWYRSSGDYDSGYSLINGADEASYNDAGAPAPTIDTGTALASDGGYYDYVRLTITGESADVHRRYYKCHLSAAGCSAKYSESNRGYRKVGSLTYQWYKSAGDDPDSGYNPIGGATYEPYLDNAASTPTINHGSVDASDGDYTDYVLLENTGASTTVGYARYYKCLLQASGAQAAYTNKNRGYRGVGTLTYQWRRSEGDGPGGWEDIDGAESWNHHDIGAPENGDGRYYRCYHTAAGAVSGYTGSDRGYRGLAIDVNTMIGGWDGWEWGQATGGETVPITTDGGMTWNWGTLSKGDVVPDGDWSSWEWVEA